jgi:hypothetical protein
MKHSPFPKLLGILGGEQVIIESPLIDEVFGERLRKFAGF